MGYIEEIRELVGHRPIILVGANVIISNQDKEILLQKRLNGQWGLPGGLMELGETIEDTARREVLEETGLFIGELDLVGVFSGNKYFFKLKNKDEFYSVTVVFFANDISGQLIIDHTESQELTFFNIETLPINIESEYNDYIDHWLGISKSNSINL